MTYQEALKRASTIISNELALARTILDNPSTLHVFIGKDGLSIYILNEEEDSDAET